MEVLRSWKPLRLKGETTAWVGFCQESVIGRAVIGSILLEFPPVSEV
jgi:hypothetical protein